MEVVVWEEWRRGSYKLAVRLSKFTLDFEQWLGSFRTCVKSDYGIEFTLRSNIATITVAASPSITFLSIRDSCEGKG